MLRIRNEPVAGLVVGQFFHYVDDFDLDGSVDIGSTTRLEGQPHAPVGVVGQFFFRGTGRGDQFRADFQKLYDEGIQVALKYLGNSTVAIGGGARMKVRGPPQALAFCAETPRGSETIGRDQHYFFIRGEPCCASRVQTVGYAAHRQNGPVA